MNIAIEPILAIVTGKLILLIPGLLNYFVAVYLIVMSILGLWTIAYHHLREGTKAQGHSVLEWFTV